MYRSGSSTRVSDEFFSNNNTSSPLLSSSSSPNPKSSSIPKDSEENHLLPTLHPQSHVAKKDKYRLRSAENAIHLIPLLLLFCVFVLWFASSPVDFANKSDSVVARVETSTTIGHVEASHAKSGLKSNIELEDEDSEDQSTESKDQKSNR